EPGSTCTTSRSRLAPRPSTSARSASSSVPDDRTARRCELCELARTTRWYAQFFDPLPFTVLDCDSCDTPMAVLGEHRTSVTQAERVMMMRALTSVVEAIGIDPSRVFFDDRMRQIPEHYHVHVRVQPTWWPR